MSKCCSVKPVIEKFPMTRAGVVSSLEKLESRHMRYRGVLYADGV